MMLHDLWLVESQDVEPQIRRNHAHRGTMDMRADSKLYSDS